MKNMYILNIQSHFTNTFFFSLRLCHISGIRKEKEVLCRITDTRELEGRLDCDSVQVGGGKNENTLDI